MTSYACAQEIDSSPSSLSTESAETDIEPVTVLAAVQEPPPSAASISSSPSSTPPTNVNNGDPKPTGLKTKAASPGRTSQSVTHRPHFSTSRPAVHLSHSMPRPTSLPSPDTPAHLPIPPHPNPPDMGHHPSSKNTKISPVAIAFEILGGIIGLFILYTAGRCFWSWKRTPSHDRIEEVLNRHYVQREMEEREREDMERRLAHLRSVSGSPIALPPPPYQHAPSYEDIVNTPHGEQQV